MKKTFLLLCLAFMAFTVNAQNLKTLTWDGQERQYLEYVPSTYSDETPTPVLFMLHGLGDDCTNFFNATNVKATAEQRGWIVVCPQAWTSTCRHLWAITTSAPVGVQASPSRCNWSCMACLSLSQLPSMMVSTTLVS